MYYMFRMKLKGIDGAHKRWSMWFNPIQFTCSFSHWKKSAKLLWNLSHFYGKEVCMLLAALWCCNWNPEISVFDDLRCFNALVDYCLVVFLFWILVFIVEMEDLYIFTLPGESMCYYVVFKIFVCAVLLKG